MSKCAAAIRQVVLVKVDSPIGEVFVVAQQVNSIPEKRKSHVVDFSVYDLAEEKTVNFEPYFTCRCFCVEHANFFRIQ